MRRSRDEILANILEVCLYETSKTRIVYLSNLNFATIDSYLDSLTKNGFIAVIYGKYKTTEKGKDLLARFREILKIN